MDVPACCDVTQVSELEPSLLLGLASDWPRECWSAAALRRTSGNVEVSAMLSSSDFPGDLRSHAPLALPFSELLDAAERPPGSLRLYLAQATLWSRDGAPAPLNRLLSLLPSCLPAPVVASRHSSTHLWVSCHGSRSGAHYDPNVNLLVLLRGAKRVRLWPPSSTPALRPRLLGGVSSNHSSLGCAESVPAPLHATLNEGDALLIPAGWWHQLDSAPRGATHASGADALTVAVNYWWRPDGGALLAPHACCGGGFGFAGGCAAFVARAAVEDLVAAEKAARLDALAPAPLPLGLPAKCGEDRDAAWRAAVAGACAARLRDACACCAAGAEIGALFEGTLRSLPAHSCVDLVVRLARAHPDALSRLLLPPALTPAAAELLTARCEAVEADEAAAEAAGEPFLEGVGWRTTREAFEAMYAPFGDDASRVIASVVDAKEAFARAALAAVVAGVLGVGDASGASAAAASAVEACQEPFWGTRGAARTVVVSFDASRLVQTLDDLYIGVNLDSGSLYRNLDTDSTVLSTLLSNLAPLQLRVGGTASDKLLYVPDGAAGPAGDNVTVLSDASWASLVGFAARSGADLLFDVNAAGFLDADNAWSAGGNASALFAATAASGLAVSGWELGNEPDLWQKHFGVSLSGAQLADNLRELQRALADAGLSTRVTGPSLAKYDAALMQSFLGRWEETGGGELAWASHAYPLGPPSYAPESAKPRCSVEHFLDRTNVEHVTAYLSEIRGDIGRFGDASATRLVLEETASNSLGGCVGFSDRFVSGFYWLPLLGIVGEAGWHQVNRQDLVGMSFTSTGSNYALVGPPGWTSGDDLLVGDDSPNADYFITLLWKRLMGRGVLSSVLVSGDTEQRATAHVWCAAASAGAPPGAVALAFTNGHFEPVAVALSAGVDTPSWPPRSRIEYVLTADPAAGGLTGHGALLNGARMRVEDDGSLFPGWGEGRRVDGPAPLVVPPLSYGFVVFPDAGAAACGGDAAALRPMPLVSRAWGVITRFFWQ